jgi:hypothetical protein
MADLFAPPTASELKMQAKQKVAAPSIFGPPTSDELSRLNTLEKLPQDDRNPVETFLGDYVAPVGRFVDKYTGAPTRAAIGAVQEEKNPITAFTSQIGQDPEKAPTGKELVQRTESLPSFMKSETPLSDVIPSLYSDTGREWTKLKRGGLLDPTPVGAAGLLVDIAADPTNLISGAAISRGVSKLAKPVVTGAAKAGAVAADVVTGTKTFSRAGEILGDIGQTTRRTVKSFMKPEVSKDFNKIAEIARKNGIDPADLSSAAEYGEHSFPSRLERGIMESPQGQAMLDKHLKTANKINDAFEWQMEKLSFGKTADSTQAGETLLKGFENAEDRVFKNATMTYRTAADLRPGMRVPKDAMKDLNSTLNGIEKRAKGMVTRGATNERVSVGRELMGMIQRFRKNGDNYRQLSEQINEIGEAAKQTQNATMKKELWSLYHDTSRSLISTVKKIDPDMGQQLITNNEKLTNFFKQRDVLGPMIKNKNVGPEKIFKSMMGDTKKIDELVELIGVDNLGPVRGAYLDSLVARNADGDVIWASTVKNLRKNSNKLERIFTPAELKELDEVIQLAQAQGQAFMSTSKTSQALQFQNWFQKLKEVPSSIAGKVAGEKTLNAIKRSARESAAQKPKGLIDTVKRGPWERNAKKAQSIAPSYYKRDEE